MRKLGLYIILTVFAGYNNQVTIKRNISRAGNTVTQAIMEFTKKIGDNATLSTAGIKTELASQPVPPGNTRPVKIIFDTDMDSDVDDVGALAMLHAMMNNGEVELLAVMVSSTCPASAACIDAINTYYGRPDLPIGVKKGNGVNRDVGFVSKVANKFPQDIGSGANAPDAKILYRQILAGLPDKSVKIITVGYLTNLEDLLKTSGDSYSKLNGRDLVNSKVSEYVCMGGKFPGDFSYQGNGNWEPDGKAAKYVNKHWPTMLSFSAGGQYQWDVKTGASLLNEDMNVNPVAFAYKEFYELVSWDRNYPNHHSADPIAVYVAVKGFKNPYTITKTSGYYYIWDNGLCEWRTDSIAPLRRISYMLKDPYQISAENLANEIEKLMLQKPLKYPSPDDQRKP